MIEFRPYPKPVKNKKKRRARINLSGWRMEVFAAYGARCVSCGHRGPEDGDHLSAHHLIFRSQSSDKYVADVRNGVPLCNWRGNSCHENVHQGKLKVQQRWLSRATLECLEEQGLVWDEQGPVGTQSKYFA